MRPRRTAALVLLGFLAAAPAWAGRSRTVEKFYEAKRASTTHEAYLRAERAARSVSVGASEESFLEALGLEVLSRGGRTRDVRLDGYLAGASKRLGRAAGPGARTLAFGWLQGGLEHVGFVVVIRDRRVAEIRVLPDAESLVADAR